MTAVTSETAARLPAVPFSEALAVWIKVGLLSFGGAAGQIAMLHTIIVDEKKWLDEKRFLHALNYCTLLPGPEAQQLATYIGWLLHGVRGGLVAGLLFVVPGALVVLGLTMLYVAAQGVPLVEGIFFGIKAAVLVIVVQAVLKMAKRVGHTPLLYGLMAASFLAILMLKLPYPPSSRARHWWARCSSIRQPRASAHLPQHPDGSAARLARSRCGASSGGRRWRSPHWCWAKAMC